MPGHLEPVYFHLLIIKVVFVAVPAIAYVASRQVAERLTESSAYADAAGPWLAVEF